MKAKTPSCSSLEHPQGPAHWELTAFSRKIREAILQEEKSGSKMKNVLEASNDTRIFLTKNPLSASCPTLIHKFDWKTHFTGIKNSDLWTINKCQEEALAVLVGLALRAKPLSRSHSVLQLPMHSGCSIKGLTFIMLVPPLSFSAWALCEQSSFCRLYSPHLWLLIRGTRTPKHWSSLLLSYN